MKIYYIGNQVAGLIGRLTVLSLKHEIVDTIDDCDILLSVHARKILPKEILNKPRIAAINVHPYLYKYKGVNPIGRALIEKNWHASVGCHRMTEVVDKGEVIKEIFIDIIPSDSPIEIYNQLYPIYVQVITESLDILEKEYIAKAEEPEPFVVVGRE